jgi:hypothetical protein
MFERLRFMHRLVAADQILAAVRQVIDPKVPRGAVSGCQESPDPIREDIPRHHRQRIGLPS